MGNELSIVLITWNSARYLERCCAGVLAQTRGVGDVVVVDNASADDSVGRVRRFLPGARVVQNETNRGFAAAANQGIAATGGDWILLLNPDVRLSPDYTEKVIGTIVDRGERCGAGTGKLLKGRGDDIEPTGLVDSCGIRMTRSGRHFDIRNGEPDVGDETGPGEVFGVSGAAAVYRRAMLDDVAVMAEVFDEDFFAFREDADLAWRSRLMGWSAVCDPSALAWHVRSVTPDVRRSLPPEINMHGVKNRFLLRLKNEGVALALRHAPWELTRDVVVLGAVLTVERTSLPAFSWLWQHRGAVMEKRREIQSRRRVSDAQLARWFR